MKLKVKFNNISRDFKSGKPIISFEVLSNINSLEEIENKGELDLEVNKHTNKRTPDCNAYMWVLIQKIAEKISLDGTIVTKEEIYRDAIRNVGAFTIVPIKTEAVEEWIRIWQNKGIGWVCETQPSKLKGFTNCLCYHGSSVYNQKEMNRLVELIVQECKTLGIETKSDKEIKSLLDSWR